MSARFTIKAGSWSSTQDFPDENPDQVTFEDLEPGTNYTLTAELYAGETLIDTDVKSFSTVIEYITDAFYLQNETAEENILTLNKYGTPRSTDLSYSLDDGSSWTTFEFTLGIAKVTIPASGRIYLRSSTGFSKDSSNYLKIQCSKNFSAHGNIQCLHNFKDLNDLTVDSYEFYVLFSMTTTLISAKYMYLPATTLATHCYDGMFKICTGLTTAPQLPATELATYCYQYMFQGCTALTTAPVLPATKLTLKTSCYKSMFQSCTSLTTAPKLPATSLGTACYQYMFKGCNSLTTAPELSATILREDCYSNMFEDCTSLVTAPELPVTTLAEKCYSYMFQGCTSLTTAPVLPATTLASYCYSNMFNGCSALSSVTTYVKTWNTINTTSWLSGAGTNATNPTVYCPSDSTIPSNNNSGIPTGWLRVDI